MADDSSDQPADPSADPGPQGVGGQPGSEESADDGAEAGQHDGDGDPAAVDGDEQSDATDGAEGPDVAGTGGRDVVVPIRLYKTVTVFSTLIAIVAILAGFVLLDRGTQRATASPDEVSLPVVALGLALIVGGSAVYAFSTRFRAEGMGKSKDDTDEPTDNG